MADNEEVARKLQTLDEMKKEQVALRKKNRAEEKSKLKRIKEQQERIEMSKDTEVWVELTKVKEQVSLMLKNNSLTSAYTLQSLSQIPNHFNYQHPTNKKLKTNNKDEEWVRSFLDNGGTEKQLLEQADKGRSNLWKRIKFKRPKSATKTKTTTTPKVSKTSGGVS